MESIELMYDSYPEVIIKITSIVFIFLDVFLLIRDTGNSRVPDFLSFLLFITVFYICFMYIITPQILNLKIAEDAKKTILPAWNEWVENREVVDSPIKNVEIDGDYLEIILVSGNTYYIPFKKEGEKRILTFKFYKSK